MDFAIADGLVGAEDVRAMDLQVLFYLPVMACRMCCICWVAHIIGLKSQSPDGISVCCRYSFQYVAENVKSTRLNQNWLAHSIIITCSVLNETWEKQANMISSASNLHHAKPLLHTTLAREVCVQDMLVLHHVLKPVPTNTTSKPTAKQILTDDIWPSREPSRTSRPGWQAQ